MHRSPKSRRTGILARAVASTVAALLVLTGCARAPGGPAGEFATSTGDVLSAVQTAEQGLTLWRAGRLPAPTAEVVVDDATTSADDALGVIIALDVRTHDDEVRRSRVQHLLSGALETIVRGRGLFRLDGSDPRVEAGIAELTDTAARLQAAMPPE